LDAAAQVGLEDHVAHVQLLFAAGVFEQSPLIADGRQAAPAEQRVTAIVLRVAAELQHAQPL